MLRILHRALVLPQLILLLTALFTLASPICAQEGFAPEKHSDIQSRMFINPTGRILPAGVVSAAFGGSFASEGGHEYLGLISIGLGDIAEFEFSTAHVLTNVLNFSEPISTTALKFRMYENSNAKLKPALVVGLRSNTWSEVSSSDNRDYIGPASPGGANANISDLEFETHQTDLFVTSSLQLAEGWECHAGATLHETLAKNVIVRQSDTETVNVPDKQRDMVLLPILGLEHQINERTHSMVEFGGKPKIKFSSDMKDLELETSWFGMAGVRYFLGEISSFDAGLRYRSDHSSLADVEIRAGLNVGINVQKGFTDTRNKAKTDWEKKKAEMEEKLKEKKE